jgi:ATPase
MQKPKTSYEIKRKARYSLSNKFSKQKKTYVIDTSAIINKFLPKLVSKGLSGKIIIPHAVMAELENMANKGREEGFIGLEEVARFHKLKKQFPVQIYFYGNRPNEMQIKFAKSGEIDALIREVAQRNNAALITADLVQAKTSQAYGLEVIFLRVKIPEMPKKRFLFWKHK